MKRVSPLLLVALAACGSAPNAPPTDARADAAVFAAKIAAMKEGERNAVFVRAIRDANQPCQAVTKAVPVQRGWVATCDDGSYWSIVPQAGGVAYVARVNAAAAGG